MDMTLNITAPLTEIELNQTLPYSNYALIKNGE